MLAQSREIDSLREQLEEAQRKLEDKTIRIRKAGSLAEASLQLTQVFEEAQKAADLYVYNMRRATLKAQRAAEAKYGAGQAESRGALGKPAQEAQTAHNGQNDKDRNRPDEVKNTDGPQNRTDSTTEETVKETEQREEAPVAEEAGKGPT